MTLNGPNDNHHGEDDSIDVDEYDDVEYDDNSRVPSSSADQSETLENDQQQQQPMGNLFG